MRYPRSLVTMLAFAVVLGSSHYLRGDSIAFQEGVSPNATYVADSISIRGDASNDGTNYDGGTNYIGYNVDEEMRALFEFDLSGLASQAGVGETIQINSVSLSLYSYSGLGEADLELGLYSYNFDFNESTATWNDPDGDGSPTTGDTTAGGTLRTLLSVAIGIDPHTPATIVFGDSVAFASFVEAAVVASDSTLRLLARRTAGTMEVYGEADRSFVRTDSETGTTASNRPRLSIDYSIVSVPEPSSWVLLAMATMGLMGAGWRRLQA